MHHWLPLLRTQWIRVSSAHKYEDAEGDQWCITQGLQQHLSAANMENSFPLSQHQQKLQDQTSVCLTCKASQPKFSLLLVNEYNVKHVAPSKSSCYSKFQMRAALTQLMHGTNTSCLAANNSWNPYSWSYIQWASWQRNFLWLKGFTLSELMAWNALILRLLSRCLNFSATLKYIHFNGT